MTVTRRVFLQGNLLAVLAFGTGPATHADLPPVAATDTDLALNRPVRVSSTDFAPTPGEFAVDGVWAVGSPRGTGWRAAAGDPQWIAVDLQAVCRVDRIGLVFEATRDTPAFVLPNPSGLPIPSDSRADTMGDEILSSYAVAFTVAVSTNGKSWRDVHRSVNATGGAMQILLPAPVPARWVRLTVTQRSNANPLGLGEFQVFGTSPTDRPPVIGWTTPHHKRVGAPPELVVSTDGTVPVETGWEMAMDDWAHTDDGVVLSQPGLDTRRWFDAIVPGTVLAALVADGALPDPVAGMNNLRVPEALCHHAWWYRREFLEPDGFDPSGSRVWLELDGVNHEAQVWLNGGFVGTLTYPFARAAFDVTTLLRSGRARNALVVRITPMPHPGAPGDRANGLSYLNSFKLDLDAPTYSCTSGWDWMPAVRDRAAGIWNHVRLRKTGDVVIGDPHVQTTLPDLPGTATAHVTVTVPVRNAAETACTVTVRIAFGPVTASARVRVPANSAGEVTFDPQQYPALRIENPRLWWPNGYGSAELYDLTLAADVPGRCSDTRTIRFGIRELRYDYRRPSIVDGQAQDLAFGTVRARYVRLVGRTRATWRGISVYTLSVYGPQAPGVDLAWHKTATAASTSPGRGPEKAVDGDPTTRWSSPGMDNQWIAVDLGTVCSVNKVRIVWHVSFAKDLAVQVSLDGVVWTDALTTTNTPASPLQISVNGVRIMCRGGNWGYDELLRRVLDGRLETAIRMHADQHFTMIRTWLGTSTREEFYTLCDKHGILVWNDFWWAGYNAPTNRQAYIDIAADTIRRYRTHPCIALWCGSNEHYPPADIDDPVRQAVADEDPRRLYQSNSAADIVNDGPYAWVDPTTYHSRNCFGFHTEIGLPTVPTAETMQRLAGDRPAWPIGAVWEYHDWCAQAQQVDNYRQAIEDRLGTATSLPDFCRKAQFVNYESMRAIFEAWNHNLWHDASGVLLWMSHPAWLSTVWQTYDYDFDVNGSYYGARKGCEPLHVQATPDTWQVDAVNHTPNALTAAASAQVFDINGTPLGATQQRTLEVPASSTAVAFAVEWPWDTVTFPTVQARYVRVADTSSPIQCGFSLRRFSVYGPDRSDDLACHKTATASSTDDPSRGPERAVDGDPATRWSAACQEDNQSADVGHWIAVDLGAVHDVDRIALTWATTDARTLVVQTSPYGDVWTTAASPTVGGLHLVKLQLHDAGGKLLSDNMYWHYGTPRDMRALNSLPLATIGSTITSHRRREDRTLLTVRLRNDGPPPAAMVVLSLRRAATGDRVLPAGYSDNYLWLLPGESRDIVVECATADLGGHTPAVQVSAYNSSPHTVTAYTQPSTVATMPAK